MYLVHYNSKKQGFLTWQRVLHTNFKITSSGFLVLMFFPFGCQPDFLKSLYYCTVHRPKTGFNSKCFFPHSGSAVLTKRLVSFCLLYNRCYVVLYPVPGICLRIYVFLCCLCLLFILIYGGFRKGHSCGNRRGEEEQEGVSRRWKMSCHGIRRGFVVYDRRWRWREWCSCCLPEEGR